MDERHDHDLASRGVLTTPPRRHRTSRTPQRRFLTGPLAVGGLVLLTTAVWFAVFTWMW